MIPFPGGLTATKKTVASSVLQHVLVRDHIEILTIEGDARCHLQAPGESVTQVNSAELKGPRKLVRIRPGIFDFDPDLGLKLGQSKP